MISINAACAGNDGRPVCLWLWTAGSQGGLARDEAGARRHAAAVIGAGEARIDVLAADETHVYRPSGIGYVGRRSRDGRRTLWTPVGKVLAA